MFALSRVWWCTNEWSFVRASSFAENIYGGGVWKEMELLYASNNATSCLHWHIKLSISYECLFQYLILILCLIYFLYNIDVLLIAVIIMKFIPFKHFCIREFEILHAILYDNEFNSTLRSHMLCEIWLKLHNTNKKKKITCSSTSQEYYYFQRRVISKSLFG